MRSSLQLFEYLLRAGRSPIASANFLQHNNLGEPLCNQVLNKTTASRLAADVRHLAGLAPVASHIPQPSSPSASTSFASRSSTAAAKRKQDTAPKSKYVEILEKLQRKEKPPPREVPPLEPRPYTSRSRRCGIVAIKAGMTQDWDEWGVRVPLTVLFVDECQVTQVKVAESDGVTSLQLGCGIKRTKSVNRRQICAFVKAGVPIKRKLVEFPVTKDALIPVGTHINAGHFVAGQYVDVTGTTKGKGFQGVMKRFGFKGMPATHGVSLAHRAPGATGGRNDPGRVWKGKKLPGRHGNYRRTLHSCFVYKVDPERNLIYIRGQVPGQIGNFILLRDSLRKKWEGKQQLPFPTHIGDTLPAVSTATTPLDPYRVYQQDIGYFSEKWKGKD